MPVVSRGESDAPAGTVADTADHPWCRVGVTELHNHVGGWAGAFTGGIDDLGRGGEQGFQARVVAHARPEGSGEEVFGGEGDIGGTKGGAEAPGKARRAVGVTGRFGAQACEFLGKLVLLASVNQGPGGGKVLIGKGGEKAGHGLFGGCRGGRASPKQGERAQQKRGQGGAACRGSSGWQESQVTWIPCRQCRWG